MTTPGGLVPGQSFDEGLESRFHPCAEAAVRRFRFVRRGCRFSPTQIESLRLPCIPERTQKRVPSRTTGGKCCSLHRSGCPAPLHPGTPFEVFLDCDTHSQPKASANKCRASPLSTEFPIARRVHHFAAAHAQPHTDRNGWCRVKQDRKHCRGFPADKLRRDRADASFREGLWSTGKS